MSHPKVICRVCRVEAAAIVLATALTSAVTLSQEPCAVTISPDWKNDVDFPWDGFQSYENEFAWIKFTILTCDPETVYFQRSTMLFHYDFATKLLDPFKGISREDFDRVALYAEGQQAILGAVIMPGRGEPREFGIQLVRRDAFSPQETAGLLELVAGHVHAEDPPSVFYFPTWEQHEAAEASRELLESRGIEIGSVRRWAPDSVVYSDGWALGRLNFVSGDDIEDAFREGRLATSDILLTDGVPATIPSLAGVITLTPSTPNSHVAILANNFGIPFVHPVFEADVELANALVGRRVALRAYREQFGPAFRLIDVEEQLDDETIDSILELKRPAPLDLSEKEQRGFIGVAVRDLVRGDERFVGGKAANYRLLLDVIPENSREAAALTFDLWDAFLAQRLGSGRTLREEIRSRLEPFSSYPPVDPAGLAGALEEVRDLFRDDERSVFVESLRAAVIDALDDERFGFDALRRLRFRSSTNVEDGDQFTGAGLYDSYSGCLADDLDADDDGPSACDATRDSERGAFRAIRRVFASFYNENAYLERLRWGVDEDDVGMAVLVHHSFPDEDELANGVIALERRFGTWFASIVSQPGAVSVTNPEDDSIPEEVQVAFFNTVTSVSLVTGASRLVLGAKVLDWRDEYIELGQLSVHVAERFLAEAGLDEGLFDLEYKKVRGEGLVVKQVRRVPRPETSPSVTPFLVNEPTDAMVFQGEGASDIFAIQRLGARFRIETRNMWLTDENLADGLYADVSMSLNDGCGGVREFSGPLGDLPGATHSWDGETRSTIDEWVNDSARMSRRLRLETTGVPTLVAPSSSPILTWRDLTRPALTASYDSPVTGHGDLLEYVERSVETVTLLPRPPENASDIVQVRRMRDGDMTVEIAFVWPAQTDGVGRNAPGMEIPPLPGGTPLGYPLFSGFKTAPLVRWIETRITGVASVQIVLGSDLSQSYHPEHHNFTESFLFEPRREPGIAPEVLDELSGRGIDFIEVVDGFSGTRIALHDATELGHRCDCEPSPRGDYSGDGTRDISDGIYLLNFLFADGPEPVPEPSRRDLNGDLRTDLSDGVFLFTYLFLGGPEPIVDCEDAADVEIDSA